MNQIVELRLVLSLSVPSNNVVSWMLDAGKQQWVFSRVNATLYSTVSVRRSVCRSVGNAFTFLRFLSCLCILKSFQRHQRYPTVTVVFVNRFESDRKRQASKRASSKGIMFFS